MSIVTRVTDGEAVVPGAITELSRNGDVVSRGKANDSGSTSLLQCLDSEYELRVSLNGFETRIFKIRKGEIRSRFKIILKSMPPGLGPAGCCIESFELVKISATEMSRKIQLRKLIPIPEFIRKPLNKKSPGHFNPEPSTRSVLN